MGLDVTDGGSHSDQYLNRAAQFFLDASMLGRRPGTTRSGSRRQFPPLRASTMTQATNSFRSVINEVMPVKLKRALVAIRLRLLLLYYKYSFKLRRNRYGLGVPRDMILDHKYGGWCGRIVPPYEHLGAKATHSIHYWQLEKLFRAVPIRESDVLVDVGCGKGRVLNYWLHQGLKNRMFGVELNEQVADWTRGRLKSYPNVTVIGGSILDNLPPGATFFFMYNPFHEPVAEQFKAALLETYGDQPDLRVLYYLPRHRNVFDDDPAWDVQELTPPVVYPAILLRIKDQPRDGHSRPSEALSALNQGLGS